MGREYPADWNSRRKKVYKRDNHTCQNCGRTGSIDGDIDLHAHHIVPKSKDGRHKLDNLVTLCSECHKAVHGSSMAPTSSSSSSGRKSQEDEIEWTYTEKTAVAQLLFSFIVVSFINTQFIFIYNSGVIFFISIVIQTLLLLGVYYKIFDVPTHPYKNQY